MITLTAPGFFLASMVAAALVGVLHLLARQERRAEPLPTARFVPNDLASSVVRADRLRDRALLALRVGAVLMIGLAAARPIWTRPAAGTMRVILVDQTASTVSSNNALNAVRALAQGAELRIIVFDTATRMVPLDALGRVLLDSTAHSARQGSISTALVAGIREGLALRARYRRVELHLVSPVATGEMDAATQLVRSQWSDSLFVHRVAAAEEVATPMTVDLAPDDEDPIGAAARLALPRADAGGNASVRMRRGARSAADSAWARSGGRVLVTWPGQNDPIASDTLAALATTSGVVVAYFARRATPTMGIPIAWWSDGTAAATEVPNGDGCIRVIGFTPPVAGDGALTFGMQRLLRRLAAPCGPVTDTSLLSGQQLADLVPPVQLVVPREAPLPAAERSWIALALLLAALLLLAAEWHVRERPRMTPEPPIRGLP
jgi:hypothetical protein